jgi:hypothetical protein
VKVCRYLGRNALLDAGNGGERFISGVREGGQIDVGERLLAGSGRGLEFEE